MPIIGLQNKASITKKIKLTSVPSQQGIGRPPISNPKKPRIKPNRNQVTKKVNKNPPISEPKILCFKEIELPPDFLTVIFLQEKIFHATLKLNRTQSSNLHILQS